MNTTSPLQGGAPSNSIPHLLMTSLQTKASEGDGEANYKLGHLYLENKEEEQSFQIAARYFEIATLAGYPIAEAALGYCYGCAIGRTDRKLLDNGDYGTIDAGCFLLNQDKLSNTHTNDCLERALASLKNEGIPADRYERLGKFYFELGELEKALEMYQQAVAIQQVQCIQNDPILAMYLSTIGHCLYRLGRFKEGLEVLRQSLLICQGRDSLEEGSTLSNIGMCLYALGEYSEALVLLEKARFLQEKLLKDSRQEQRSSQQICELAITLNRMGLCLRASGHYQKALEIHSEAYSLLENNSIPNDPDLAYCIHYSGECLGFIGKFRKALEKHEQAHTMLAIYFGHSHHSVATCRNSIGICYYSLGQFQEALAFFQESLNIREKVYGQKNPHVASCYNHIANCYAALGKLDDAIAAQNIAINIRKDCYGDVHPLVATSLNNLASYLSCQGRIEDALGICQQVLSIREKYFDKNHPEVMLSLSYIHSLQHPIGIEKEDHIGSSLSYSDFQGLAIYVGQYLKDLTPENVLLKVNPSGFVRIHIPVPKHFSEKIEVLRLNYWPPEFKIETVEALHNHPRYFESMVIHGGYTHAIYKQNKDNSELPSYRIHRIFKSDYDARNIFCIGALPMEHVADEEVKENTPIAFPQSLVHQVLHAQPSTLTINCVFKRQHDQNIDYFNVFMPKDSFDDPQKDRETLISEESDKTFSEIKELINNWVSKA